VVTENGYGKRTSLTEYPVKGRGGKGVLTAKLTAKKGGLAGARVVREGQELIFISQTGMVQRNAVGGISRMGRPTQGVRLMNLKKGDLVSAVALVVESTDQNGNGASATEASVEDEAPTAATLADEAAAAEAAGNGEAKVTKAKPSRPSGSARTPAEKSAGQGRASAANPKPKPASKPKPAPKKRSSSGGASAAKPKPATPKVKPKHTATARQRAEADKKRKR
jgi:DNA gyrase C-terminal domain, beta-propeller